MDNGYIINLDSLIIYYIRLFIYLEKHTEFNLMAIYNNKQAGPGVPSAPWPGCPGGQRLKTKKNLFKI